jgi:hypothetical protein
MDLGQSEFDKETAAIVSLRRTSAERLGKTRVRLAKAAFTTRRVELADAATLIRGGTPAPGDLLLAEVLSIGHHTRLEAPSGRRRELYPGDEILLAYGSRYASDQFDAVVPTTLVECDLVAAGGLAGCVVHRHSRTSRPTRLKPLGLLGDKQGQVINLKRYALERPEPTRRQPMVIAIVGTSMNAGKTSACSSLVRGLARAGLRVGAAKLTGTGSGGDLWSMIDAGAREVIDFTDMGYASTHLVPHEEVLAAAIRILDHLATSDHDMIVVEIADGLLQPETAMLMSSPRFKARLSGVIFAAGDSMGAAAGIEWLSDRNLPVLGFSGLVTASPLARAEAEAVTRSPSFSLDELRDPELAPKLCLGDTPLLGPFVKHAR